MGKNSEHMCFAFNRKKIHMSRLKGNTPLTDRARGAKRFWENLGAVRRSTFNFRELRDAKRPSTSNK
jgi:hypothetical protein